MDVGAELVRLAEREPATSGIAVVGIGKNVGKTVAVRAILRALRGRVVGLTSIGRDGEAFDVADGESKPRLSLDPGTLIATAREALPPSPASEILSVEAAATAAGRIVIARVRDRANYEIVGPPIAAEVRAALDRLRACGASFTVLDGAVDRVAAIAGGGDAIVVATGAAAAEDVEGAVERARALVARLSVPPVDPSAPARIVEGALTASRAAELIAEGERRQVVVRDPTRIALAGRAFEGAALRLTLRCERPLRVIAVTVAPIGRDRYFEPADLLRRVRAATGLPVFDVYAGAGAA